MEKVKVFISVPTNNLTSEEIEQRTKEAEEFFSPLVAHEFHAEESDIEFVNDYTKSTDVDVICFGESWFVSKGCVAQAFVSFLQDKPIMAHTDYGFDLERGIESHEVSMVNMPFNTYTVDGDGTKIHVNNEGNEEVFVDGDFDLQTIVDIYYSKGVY